jgi:hypothetical protein
MLRTAHTQPRPPMFSPTQHMSSLVRVQLIPIPNHFQLRTYCPCPGLAQIGPCPTHATPSPWPGHVQHSPCPDQGSPGHSPKARPETSTRVPRPDQPNPGTRNSSTEPLTAYGRDSAQQPPSPYSPGAHAHTQHRPLHVWSPAQSPCMLMLMPRPEQMKSNQCPAHAQTIQCPELPILSPGHPC